MSKSKCRRCGCIVQNQVLMEIVEGYREKRLEIEQLCKLFESDQIRLDHARSTIVTIPIVVHVLYNKKEENISDEQIDSQIRILNEDFAGTNADIEKVPDLFKPLVGKSNIQFALAKKDPQGKATNGITRTKTERISFPVNETNGADIIEPVKFDSKGGKDAWPSEKYLNIWVCNLGGGFSGYAQFPGGPPETDGVIIGHNYFGDTGTARNPPYNKGRTTTHEVGHYLNLHHIWGDDQSLPDPCSFSDFVDDTPNQDLPTNGAPTHPRRSCGSPDMFMNYMDYTDDAGMFMFSKGQVARMQTTLSCSRASLTTSADDVLTPPSV